MKPKRVVYCLQIFTQALNDCLHGGFNIVKFSFGMFKRIRCHIDLLLRILQLLTMRVFKLVEFRPDCKNKKAMEGCEAQSFILFARKVRLQISYIWYAFARINTLINIATN